MDYFSHCLGISANPVFAEGSNGNVNELEGDDSGGLRKIEDGSVVSNEHTSKWRIFTDNGRDYFLQGKVREAEKFFRSALEEAKKGFGDRDPHVASSCNNLAELYRVKKEFDKAEPLYLEAINILEESYGPDDVRVGAAFHNLGQFYLVQRKLEEACKCYERALKIKRRVLGHGHTDYADTMYHLGTVLYLLGKEKEAEDLIQDSIKILEGAGQGESIICMRRLRYLSQMYLKSNRLSEAENVQRKILHIMELSTGWDSLDTVIAAEKLTLTLQATGNLKEAQELLERCLDTRKSILSEDHIQIGGNMLQIARVAILNANQHRQVSISEAVTELDKAKDLLYNATRIARQVLNKLKNKKGSGQKNARSEETRQGRMALIILLQSFDALGNLEITKQELLESTDEEPESALFQCVSAYKELFSCLCTFMSTDQQPFKLCEFTVPLAFCFYLIPQKITMACNLMSLSLHPSELDACFLNMKTVVQYQSERSIADCPEVKVEYLSCLKRLSSLITDNPTKQAKFHKHFTMQELNNEIKDIEGEISRYKKLRSSGRRS